jgi:hypothetical protein
MVEANKSREKAHKLIDLVPDEKIAQVIVILEAIKSLIDDESNESRPESVKEAGPIPFEDMLGDLGVNAEGI